MKDVSDLKFSDPAKATRATKLRERIRAAGLTIADFRRKTGLSRNVVYGLTKGRQPKPDEAKIIDDALHPY
jgi:hypothetical protein